MYGPVAKAAGPFPFLVRGKHVAHSLECDVGRSVRLVLPCGACAAHRLFDERGRARHGEGRVRELALSEA
jgi:hypothetical protein